MTGQLYIGLMSGTSLDGVDCALVSVAGDRPELQAAAFHAFPGVLRGELLALNSPGQDEVDRSARAAIAVTRSYAQAVADVLKSAGTDASRIEAIGCHGQTIRHRPEAGYSVQIGSPALLAELCRITVVADFRSRDIAAGGQGAPLVPAFHAASFGSSTEHRVILNLGGIANVTDLPLTGAPTGFDTGPANLLLDGWAGRHRGVNYDDDGAWAATGRVQADLLAAMLQHEYFSRLPPKSTGRDQFNENWLDSLRPERFACEDVQATLLALTAQSIGEAIAHHCNAASAVFACGGGVRNGALMRALRQQLRGRALASTVELGIHPDWVEAAAFAWLAKRTMARQAGNLPAVTGARGPRILGAIYPA